MSEDKSSKTEKATPKKLKDARKKGQVPKSKDIVATTILAFVFTYFIFFWESIQRNIEFLILSPKYFYTLDTPHALAGMADVVLENVLINILLPFFVVIVLGGIIGNLIQFGFLFSWDPLKPEFKKINPVAGFKRIFSLKQVKTTLISLLKILSISLVLYFVVQLFLSESLFSISQCHVDCQKSIMEYFVKILVVSILFINIFLSIIDYVVQRAQFMKEQKMAKHEVKRERKDMEGDPEMKAHRKRLQHEFITNDITKKIRESRIIIYGSGFSVSLHYEEGVTPVPIITSIGKAKVADKMISIAQSENIPLYESSDTVLSIVTTGTIDQYIPEESIPKVVTALKAMSIL